MKNVLRHGRKKKIISYRIKSLLPSKIYRLYQSIYKKLLYCYGIPFSNARYATALNRLNYIFYKGSIYNAKFSFPKMLTGLYPPETIPLPSGPAGSGTTRLPPLLRRRLVRIVHRSRRAAAVLVHRPHGCPSSAVTSTSERPSGDNLLLAFGPLYTRCTHYETAILYWRTGTSWQNHSIRLILQSIFTIRKHTMTRTRYYLLI